MTDRDEGAEDDNFVDDSQQGLLERMLRAHAMDHFEKAQKFHGGVPAYFQNLVRDVTQEYKNSHAIQRNIYDFSVDRYIFYRRHREMDVEEAIQESYIDTFQYLVFLKNEYPTVRPPMKDDWM